MTDTSICFDQLNLVCADLEAAIAFYRLLGVAIPEQSLWGSETRLHHVSDIAFGPGSMDLDSTELADVYNAGHRTGGSVGACVLGFRISSRQAVDDLHKRMVDAGHPQPSGALRHLVGCPLCHRGRPRRPRRRHHEPERTRSPVRRARSAVTPPVEKRARCCPARLGHE